MSQGHSLLSTRGPQSTVAWQQCDIHPIDISGGPLWAWPAAGAGEAPPGASNQGLGEMASKNNHSVISDRNGWAAGGEETLLLTGRPEVFSAVGSSGEKAALQGPREREWHPQGGKGAMGAEGGGEGAGRGTGTWRLLTPGVVWESLAGAFLSNEVSRMASLDGSAQLLWVYIVGVHGWPLSQSVPISGSHSGPHQRPSFLSEADSSVVSS